MNTSELKSKRIAQNKDVSYMASVIGKSNDAYAKKERGVVKFTPDEIASVANDLCLSPAEFNSIFFDSRLLFGKCISKRISEL
jgi:hypothetical protein